MFSRSLKLYFSLFFCLIIFTTQAHAELSNAGVLDSVLDRYLEASSAWGEIITGHATWLFWTLATISLAWTFGFMALQKSDISEFLAELIRFITFTGFFYWLLVNGPTFAIAIIQSLQQIGSEAAGLSNTLSPSSIVDIGFEVFWKVLDNTRIWSPIDSAVSCIMALIILVVLTLVGLNMLLLLVSAWILAYAGIFFLGFGGSRWTSDMAINYYKTVLGIAVQLFTMVLLIGIGSSFLNDYYAQMNEGISLKDMSVLMIVTVVLLGLVNKIPPLLAGIITGDGGGRSGIGGVGVGALMGAAGMAAAVASSGGAAMLSGAASAAGGAQAITAAISKASETMANGTGETSSGGNSGNGAGEDGSPLAAAMGGNGSTPNAAGSSSAVSSESSPSGFMGKVKTAGKFTAEVGKNLAKGASEVAKGKVDSIVNAGKESINETFGGQVAQSIKNSGSPESTFGNDSLSGTNPNKTNT